MKLTKDKENGISQIFHNTFGIFSARILKLQFLHNYYTLAIFYQTDLVVLDHILHFQYRLMKKGYENYKNLNHVMLTIHL